ncbi:MAG: glycosyltransferase family 9 protein [Cyanobacteria bacterium P01_A01_bin.116]
MRILALVPGGISEQLLFFPALEDIKKAYPNAEIGVVVDPRAASAYRVSKIVDTVVPFAFSSSNSPSDWANLLGLIRDREYEVVLSTDTKWGMGLLLWLSGVPTRITYDSTATPWFYTATVPDVSGDSTQYKAQHYYNLLSAIDIQGSPHSPTINLPEGDLAWANTLRDRQNLKDGYVLMYPGPEGHRQKDAADASKFYPTDSWHAVIKDFREKQPDMPIVLLQTNHSTTQVNELKNRDQQLIIVTSENLGQTAAIIAGANLVLTPDSYVMQISVALKVFTLALFGIHQPSEMLPHIEGDETRFLGIASGQQKIADIKPETVLQKVWGN